jgi:hypothetical protein
MTATAQDQTPPYPTPTRSPSFSVRSTKISDEEKAKVLEKVRIVPNFPKPGLAFKDLSMLLGDPQAFQLCIDVITKRVVDKGITGDAPCTAEWTPWRACTAHIAFWSRSLSSPPY